VLSGRNVTCIFVNNGDKSIEYPYWFNNIVKEHDDIMRFYGEYSARKLENLAYNSRQYEFIPTRKQLSFLDKWINKQLFAFLIIYQKQVDGVDSYIAVPRVIKSREWTEYGDAEDEVWELADKSFPTASVYSNEFTGHINRIKIAREEAERKRIEDERLAALREYRNEFDLAHTEHELREFIKKYASNDPDNLIPEAKKKIPQAIKRQEQLDKEREIRRLEYLRSIPTYITVPVAPIQYYYFQPHRF
jgi:hypothetical protein